MIYQIKLYILNQFRSKKLLDFLVLVTIAVVGLGVGYFTVPFLAVVKKFDLFNSEFATSLINHPIPNIPN